MPATLTNTNTITTTITNTEPVTNTVTNTNTNTITNTTTVFTDTDPVLVPGHFEPVFDQLKKVLGNGGALGAGGAGQTHMHTNEVRYRDGDATHPPEMFNCSYTFSVVNATNPESVPYMAQGWTWPAAPDPDPSTSHKPRAPGCQHLAFDDGDMDIVYAAQHGNIDDGPGFLSAVDLNHTAGTPTSATLAPVLGPQLLEPSAAYEGIDFEGGHLYAALHDGGLGVYHRDPLGLDGLAGTADDNTLVVDVHYTAGLVNVWDVSVRGTTAYVADATGLFVLDVTDPLAPVQLGYVVTGGIARDIELNESGTLAFVATETAGWVVVDVSNPAAPTVLSSRAEPSAVVAVAEDDGLLAVAAWNDTRLYDVSDPANPVVVGGSRVAVPKAYADDNGERPDITGRTLAVDLHGDILFNGDWWTPYTFRVHPERVAPYLYLPETVNLLGFPGDLDVGESSTITLPVYNDGNADLTLYDNWIDNPAFTVTPWQVVIPPGGTANLTLTFTASVVPEVSTGDTGGAPQPVEEIGFLHLRSDDPSQPERVAYLMGNMSGLSVGDPFPQDMSATLVDGTDWTYAANGSGNVLLFAYFATY